MSALILAAVIGLIGNAVADEVGLANGFCATLVIATSWVLFDPDRSARTEERAALGLRPATELTEVQKRYVRRARIGLTVATLTAAVLGGWRHAAFYSVLTFLSAIALAVVGTLILLQYAKHRVTRPSAS